MSFTIKDITEIIGFLAASGVVSILLTSLLNKRKSKAEVQKLVQETDSEHVKSAATILSMAQSLIKDISAERVALADENERLEETVGKLNEKINEFQTQVESLKKQVNRLEGDNITLRKILEEVQIENELLKRDMQVMKKN